MGHEIKQKTPFFQAEEDQFRQNGKIYLFFRKNCK